MPTIQQLQQQIYYLQLRLDRLNHAVCCASTGIPFVTTEDSATVTFSGTGTADDPLIATAIGDSSNPPNLLIAATDASGDIIDGTSNVISRTLNGFTVGANTAIVAADTILAAFGKTQGQIAARAPITTTATLTGTQTLTNKTITNPTLNGTPTSLTSNTGAWNIGGSVGTAGYVLVSSGAGASPTWQAPPVIFEGAALPGDLTPYPEGSLFIIT